MATKLFFRSLKPCRGNTSVEGSLYTCLSSILSSRTMVLTRLDVYTSHQKVVLEVDFSGKFWVRPSSIPFHTPSNHRLQQGYTEITVVPTSKDLKTIHLHARQCGKSSALQLLWRERRHVAHARTDIDSVTVASHPADFVHSDPIANLSVSDATDVHHHPELKRKVYSALQEGDEGELSIAIPKEVSLRQSGHRSMSGLVSEGKPWILRVGLHGCEPSRVAATPEPQTPGHPSQQSLPVPEFIPILVHIKYSIKNPADGVQFVLPSESYQTVGAPW